MLDTLTSENYNDFNRRYVDTYGWLITGGKKRFVYIASSDRNTVQFTTGGDFKYTASVDAGVMFEFIPIDRGWHCTEDGRVFYLERVPARQWRRGISSNNTKIVELGDRIRMCGLKFDILKSIFENPNPYQYVPQKACALSKHFAVSSKQKVYFNDNEIGTCVDNIIKFTNDVVKQELSDLIRRNNYPLKVQ